MKKNYIIEIFIGKKKIIPNIKAEKERRNLLLIKDKNIILSIKD